MATSVRRSREGRRAYDSAVTTFGLVIVGLLMVIGLLGVVIPVLPGLLLVLGAGLWWAIADGGTTAHWVAFGAIALIFCLGTAAKYVVPARRTAAAGAVTSSMVFALILGIVGMFVIPIVGAPIGFVLGIYLAELRRLRDSAAAWAATKAALKGVGLSILIEFTAGVLMIASWAIGVWTT